MTLAEFSDLAQVIGAAAVVASLIFVGVQLRQNTAALQRGEHNSTMGQWSTIRMSLACNSALAEVWSAALANSRALSAPEIVQVESMLAEHLWAGFHIWDREQRRVFPPGTFALNAGPLIAPLLSNAFGASWWAQSKSAFPPGFAPEVDKVLARQADGTP